MTSATNPSGHQMPLMAANSACSSMFFVINPLPSNDDEMNDKILETVEKLRFQGNANTNNNNNVPVINFPSTASTESLLSGQPATAKSQTVLQCVVNRNHVAVLFDDYRVCRFPFTIYAERINSSAQTESSTANAKKCGVYPQAVISTVNVSGGGAAPSAPAGGGSSGSQRSIPSRRRMVRRGGSSRSSTSVIMNRNPMIPAQYVPEELVNQAQVVLQGKSRNLIIRELQRTNLDVNLAVNNLLSRDDEDFDDADDSPDQLIHSEDLMSLLDSGFQNDHSVIIDPDFNDEVFTYPLRIRSANSIFPPGNGGGSANSGNTINQTSGTAGSNSAANSTGLGSNSNPTSGTSGRIRLRDEPYSFIERDLSLSTSGGSASKRWYTAATQEPVKSGVDSTAARTKKTSDSQQLHLSPISLADQQELWPGSGSGNPEHKFVQIAALHSELIAINSNGQLCQWRWVDAEPFKAQTNDGTVYYHPRAPTLGLLPEKITLLAASMVRATVVTESNKLATWIDESIAPVAWKLEHTAANSIFTETLAAASSGPTFRISSLYVSSLMSCVQLSSGPLFWWGTPPFSHRKRMAEKGQNERSKSNKAKTGSESRTSSSSAAVAATREYEIVQGTFVCMRNSPIYQAGAIGFTTVGGVPKVGQLVTAAWKMSDSYSFRVLTPQEIQARMSFGSGGGSIAAAPVPSTTPGQTKNPNLDRSEMPPPPSPASSTSSESSSTNAPITVKRARGRNLSNSQQQAPATGNQSANCNEDKSSDRVEMWNLRDVVFVDDTRNMPIGRVIKVDGNFVAVKFQNTTTCVAELAQPCSRMNAAGDGLSIESYIQDCRLLRKEDLMAVRSGFSVSCPSVGGNSTGAPVMIGNKAYDYLQRFPKRVPLAEHMQILAMTLSNLGLHAIAKIGGYRLSYLHINIVSGRIEHDNKLSIECSTMFASGSNPKSSLIRLFSAGENEQTTVVVCRDGNGTLYPLAKDCTNTVVREPIALNLGPVTSVGLGVFSLPHIASSASQPQTTNKSHAAVLALSLDRQYLMPAILTGNLDLVRERLSLFENYPAMFHSMISEICDGNHNILHIAVSCCFPSSNKPPPPPPPPCNDSAVAASLQIHVQVEDEDVERCSSALNDATNDNSSDQAPPATTATVSAKETNTNEPVLDPTEQKPMAHSILWTLLDSAALSRHLFDLLSARDYQGLTPFMLAINGRAYSAAQQIFVVMQRVARMIASNNESNSSDSTTQDIYQRAFIQMLYPRGSSPDHSPLYMLCSNDTCSFTWTGEVHINQDIFECRTCGLVGSLCCCTECARVCHRGHDCKLKKTSPTAYCDCWEKCKCKALIAGCQPARYLLLKRLLAATDLSQRVNSRGEHILLFLVQTVGRQIIEQKQYRPIRTRPFSNSGRAKNELNEEPSNVPEHDLEPPKFARRVLEKMLGDWPTVKSMILTGYRSSEAASSQRRRSYLWNFNGAANTYSYEEENSYLACQNGSALLDKFTHLLLKIGLHDAIDRITCTIVQACRNQATANEARTVARRFVRSIIRVSLVVQFEANPLHYSVAYSSFGAPSANYVERYLSATASHFSVSAFGSSSSSTSTALLSMLRKIRKLFVALLPIACEELCEIAESLIAPVKLGLARPSTPFLMLPVNSAPGSSTGADSGNGNLTDELFSVDTSVYSHQRDFLDSAFAIDAMMDETSSATDNVPPPSSHVIWNSAYESSAGGDVGAGSNSENLVSRTSNRSSSETAGQQPRVNANDVITSPEVDLAPIYDLSHSNDSGSSSAPPSAAAPSVPVSNIADGSGSTSTSAFTSAATVNNATSRPAPPPPEILIDRALSDDQEMVSDNPHDTGASGDSQLVMELLVAHSEPDDNSNVGGRDTESDSESNPDDASYLSNADNASAQRSVVTGATAGSDVGVASLPYDDESMNSNPDDVDDDDEDEQDVEPDDDESSDSDDASDTAETEPDTDVLSTFINDTVERRMAQNASNVNTSVSSSASANASNRHNIMQHVQWALRSNRDLSSTPASNVPESSSFRRSAISNALASVENVVQIGNSMIGLSRAFSIIVRHIADLLVIVRDAHMEMAQIDFPHLLMSQLESRLLLQAVEERLGSTWFWLINCMDCTETQLRFGCALSNRRLAPSSSSNQSSSTASGNASSSSGANSGTNAASSTAVSQAGGSNATQSLTNSRLSRMRTFQSQDEMAMLPNFNRNTLRRTNGVYVFNRPPTSTTAGTASLASGVSAAVNVSSSGGNQLNESNTAAHRDFLNYAMSLMRAHSNEHYDSLPVLDVSSLKYVAYVFDAFVYFMRRGFMPEFPGHSAGCLDRMANKEDNSGRNHVFFRRSNSTLYLGCPRPDPFSAPYHEALPLASKPQLLQPNSRREQLFGIPRPSSVLEAEEMLQSLPAQMSLSKRNMGASGSGQSVPVQSRSQSVITESPSHRSCIVQAQPPPNKPSVIVMAGSAKHQQQQQSSSSGYTTSDYCPGKSNAIFKPQYFGNVQQQDTLLGRWRLTLELFGRLFVDHVSFEPNSIIHELSGFPIKEIKFRRDMERLRITSSGPNQRDLNFYKLDRDRNALLIQTFKELNSVFSPVARRLPSHTSIMQQPLTITRVKVTFKDEPGEGAGVARSFYAAFSEAVLANEKLPSELLLAGAGLSPGGRHSSVSASGNYESYPSYVLRLRSHSGNNNSVGSAASQRSGSGSNSAPPNSSSSPVNDAASSMRRPRSPGRFRPFYSTSSSARRTQLIERIRNMHEPRNGSSSTAAVGSSGSISSPLRRLTNLRYDAPSFVPPPMVSPRHSSFMSPDSRTAFGIRVYNRVYIHYPAHAAKITGMLMDLYPDMIPIVNNEDELRMYMEYAMEVIQINEGNRAASAGSTAGVSSSHSETGVSSADGALNTSQPAPPPSFASQLLPFLGADIVYEAFGDRICAKHKSTGETIGSQLESSFTDEDLDNAPLFYQPGTRGFYSPRAGRASEARLNAFRNVGRVIGVCFVQNELCPITFNRHVIKMILGMTVAWHDLAFFDSDLYESLRQLILDAQSSNKEEIFNECDFNFTINLSPEEGGHEIELEPNGRNIRVTPQNVYNYVRRYAQYRMVESQEKAIMALRAGIFDVIPPNSFDGLTPEDFRLLLNGVNEINVQQLQAYVTFYDESGAPDPISVFRRWFWWVLERMTNEEKQDLIYFWTGSPALPASEEGFQPMPSVTIRPRDDYYFVTANTCISRLYIPLYSSRNILRQKLLMSIKSKSFDFI